MPSEQTSLEEEKEVRRAETMPLQINNPQKCLYEILHRVNLMK